MTRTILQRTVLTAAMSLLLVSSAFAITFYPNGDNPSANQGPYGFIPVGPVQNAFDWNNPQLQDNAALVSFAVVYQQTFTQDCVVNITPAVPQGPPFKTVGTRVRTDLYQSELSSELRLNPQDHVTGFNLTGVGDPELILEGSWRPGEPGNLPVHQGTKCPAKTDDQGNLVYNPQSGRLEYSHPQGPETASDPEVVGFFASFDGGPWVQLASGDDDDED